MSRLHKTLADYLVIAVSPGLIMVLIGSLVFFLLEIFYRGNYEDRVHFVFAAFIFAAVLIGRIAIELGSERAVMYALALAAVTMLALSRFVDAPFVLNLGLIALIWWCAHKLTFDCTLIDESQDSSGEGLVQLAGLVKQPDQAPTPAAPDQDAGQTAKPPEGVTSREETPRSWRERLLNPPSRPHAPGVWIVYFSLVALPLFGFLQRFVPAGSRRYAFQLLVVYCASALGLLLTTSFLGLRRYLRQRRLQMPGAMAGMWIAIGCTMLAALLALAALLPRPNAEYAISELPLKLLSPSQKASRHAVGKESADENTERAPPGSKQETDEEKAKDSPAGTAEKGPKGSGGDKGSKTSKQGEAKGGESKSRESKGGESKGRDSNGAKSKQAESQGSQGKSGKSRDDGATRNKSESRDGNSKEGEKGADSKEAEPKEAESKEAEPKREPRKDEPAQQDSQGKPEESQENRPEKPAPKKDELSKSRSGNSRPASSPTPRPPSIPLEWTAGSLGTIFKWILYAVLIGVGLYAAWRSRAELAAALRRLLESWRGFWEWLFGGRRKPQAAAASPETVPAQVTMRRLADFIDPFATGTAGRYSPDELVRYSFEALEAWGRENGCPRPSDQTAHEFAQQVGAMSEPLARDARLLADLYCRVAYAPGTLPLSSARPLESLWRGLRAERVPIV